MNDLDVCLLNVALSARVSECELVGCSCRCVGGNEVGWVVTKCSTEQNKAICLSKVVSFELLGMPLLSRQHVVCVCLSGLQCSIKLSLCVTVNKWQSAATLL